MNRKPWIWIAAAVAWMALPQAHAQHPQRHAFPPGVGAERPQAPPAQAQVHEAQDGQERGAQPTGRMSPEERRQLRRDIHQAGRELYRPHQPRPLP